MKIHVEVWIASRILGANGRTFSKKDVQTFISDKFNDRRPGVSAHTSSYCVAGVKANPGKYRYLTSVGRGLYRVYRPGDPTHPSKANVPFEPEPSEVPAEYRHLLGTGLGAGPSDVARPPVAPDLSASGPIVLRTEEDVEKLVFARLARTFGGDYGDMRTRITIGRKPFVVERQGKVPYRVGNTRITHKNDLLISDEKGRPMVGIEVVFRSAVTDHFKTRSFDVQHMKREFPDFKGLLLYVKSNTGISPELAREISYAFDLFLSIPEREAGSADAWTPMLETIAGWLEG